MPHNAKIIKEISLTMDIKYRCNQCDKEFSKKKVIFLNILKYTHAKKRINVVTVIRDIHEKMI